jgi:1,4-dihydroxy-2-naphthoate octaprenyltransferase
MTAGHTVLVIGVAGIAIAWAYTGTPVRLAHRGLGELGIFLAFGILPALGAEYVQREALSLEVAWLGVPLGLLVAAILLINEFPDAEADAEAGKRHLVVRLGRPRAVALYEMIVGGAYLAIGIGIVAGWVPVTACVVLFAAPLTWRAVRVLREHHGDVRAMLPAQAATIGQQAAFTLLLAAAYLLDIGKGVSNLKF